MSETRFDGTPITDAELLEICNTQIADLQSQLSAEREANERLREAAEAVLWASNVERIYAAEGEELGAIVKERREAFAALAVALEGKQE